MVDFNNQSTVGTPAVDIVRVLVLERRANLFEAVEDYKKKQGQGIDPPLGQVKARLFVLWLELEAQYIRKFGKEKADPLIEQMKSKEEEEIFKVISKLNEYLDWLKLTKLDNKIVYDPTLVETENKVKGLG